MIGQDITAFAPDFWPCEMRNAPWSRSMTYAVFIRCFVGFHAGRIAPHNLFARKTFYKSIFVVYAWEMIFIDPKIILMGKVKKTPSGCWNWTGGTNGVGYGKLQTGGVKWLTHRLSYSLHIGPIPVGMCVCHRCDNPGCVRPDHLFLGTHQDNMLDKERKGRANHVRGSALGKGKLSEDTLKSVWKRILQGDPVRSIAEELSVSRETIYLIRRGATWTHCIHPEASTGSRLTFPKPISKSKHGAKIRALEIGEKADLSSCPSVSYWSQKLGRKFTYTIIKSQSGPSIWRIFREN